MIISKNTFIIGASILAVASGVIGFYLLSKNKPETLEWMNSSWIYRKSISVGNSGSELTNEDVLVTIDTETLINASKLQSDCDDLRFTDSDESTALDYWVEGGCDTSATQVWVRIPTLPSGGKTIYVYYGNSEAVNAEETWSGVFISLYDATCPSGWTRDKNFDNTFPYGASTAGTTGGSSTHSHLKNGTTSAQNSSCQDGTGQKYGGGSHGFSTNTGTDTRWPPYLDMIYCNNSDYNPYAGMITLFDASVPTGWTRFAALDSKFPRGASTYGGTGGAATHTHSFSGGTTGNSGSSSTSGSCFTSACALAHTHTFSIDSVETGSSLPPYKTVIWGEANGATVLSDAIFMVTANPPLGWIAQSGFNDYFFYGAETFGKTGGTTTHTHTISGSTSSTSSSNCCGDSTTSDGFATSSAHSIAPVDSSSASHIPPFYTVIVSKRKTSQSATLGIEESPSVLSSTSQRWDLTEGDSPNELPTSTSPYCEGATNPTKVTDTTPEFSSIFSDNDALDTGTYYEIEIMTIVHCFEFPGAMIWDTGKTAISTPLTNGSRSIDYSHAGSALTDGMTYCWRMRFWDSQDGEGSWSSVGTFTMSSPPAKPTVLKTDAQTNPTQLASAYPTFSAKYEDPDGDNSSAYEIEVNSASNFEGTVMWNTGKTSKTITSGVTGNIASYAGTLLSNSATTYYWRLRFWDTDDKVSEWSDTAQFTDTYPSFKFEGVGLEGLKIN